MNALSTIRSLSPTWAGYGACVWTVVFAAMSFYWAIGGTTGLDTLSPTIQKLAVARDSQFIAITWITGVLKLCGGVFALALVQPWGRKFPRWLLLIATWGAAVVLLVHGGDFMVRGVLWGTGLISVPETVDSTVILGYTFLWGPWWLGGGSLFGVAAWNYTQRGYDQRGGAA